MARQDDLMLRNAAIRRATRRCEGPKTALIEIYSDLEAVGASRRAATLRNICARLEAWQHKYRNS